MVVFAVGNNELAIHKSNVDPQRVLGLTFRVSALESVQQRLAEEGIPFDGPTLVRPGMTGIVLTDPNGNTLAFLRHNVD